MAGVRQLKIIGLTALVICLVFILHRTGASAASLVHAQASDQIPHKQKSPTTPPAANANAQNIVNDFSGSNNNDDKVDEAINREIEKDRTNNTPAKPKEEPEKKPSEVKFDPAAELINIRSLSPMTIFSKSYCPYSKRIKELLFNSYTITPPPNVVELDKHEHGTELQAYLKEKSGRGTVPNVLVGSSFDSRGGSDEFQQYHTSGELISMLEEWGAGRLQVKKNNTPSNV
ncbi:Monothiol glutaredoxin-7 [Spathaspora sp. JA1]|nr:Monothiol glutaredoxin-7 [Spathaspora sp. JA1]